MGYLDDLGTKHKTDKASYTHGYLDTYEKYFESWRDKDFVLWELGVAAGNSIRMWREYFPNARVFGVDNNPDCAMDGVFIGDATNYNWMMNQIMQNDARPDIIIDDASHYGPSTIKTFNNLFGALHKGGFYVVEDTACFYDKTYGEAPEYGQGMSEVFKFFTSLAIDVDVYGRAMTGNAQYAIDSTIEIPPVPAYSRILDSIHIHTSLWLFKRK